MRIVKYPRKHPESNISWLVPTTGYSGIILLRCLEVLIEAETVTVGLRLLFLLRAGHDTSLLVVTHPLLKEVGLTRQRDRLHEVEGVRGVVVLLVAKGHQQAVRDELDVLAHQLRVHAQQSTGQSVSQELLLNADGLDDDVLNNLLAGAVVQVGEQQAGEVGVQTLITRDELVGEGQTRHETTLLEPEDGSEGTGEENTLHGSESNETLSEGRFPVLDPLDGPIGLLGNAGDCRGLASIDQSQSRLEVHTGINSVEEVGALLGFLDVGIDEERVGLGVDVLHHDLETVEATSLRDLDLAAEALDEVLVDNAIGGSEERENVGDEVALVVVQAVVPVVQILGKINFLGGPERGLGLLVHLPDLSGARMRR